MTSAASPQPAANTPTPEDKAAWAQLLTQLIERAQSALLTGDVRHRLAAQEALIDFTRRCDPIALTDLHRLANGAASDLFRATVEAALRSLASRSQQLTQITAALTPVAHQARHTASHLRLSTALKTVQALRHAAQAADELRTALATRAPADELMTSINTTIDHLMDLSARIDVNLMDPRRE
jgi:tRNA U34 5-carboxymethylaminomethyl modifying GTPase MnmE/TrmE